MGNGHLDIGRFGVWASHLGRLPWPQAREAARAIDDLGYGTIWVGEAEGKEALVHAGQLLAVTQRATVATGIANIWARDPMAMVNGARTLAEGSDGRFLLGVGASHAPLLERRGQDYSKPLTAMRRYLDAMDEAPWTGPEVGTPRRVLAALGPKMLELAATRADGAHTYFVPVEHTRQAREALGDGLLAPEQAFVVASSRDEARSVAGGHVDSYLSLPNYRSNLERLGWSRPDADDDDLFDAVIAWGDVDAIAERVQAHLDAGADHVAVHPLTPDPSVYPIDDLRALADVLGL